VPDDAANEVNDEELARRARAGSKECFSELVRRFDATIYSFLWVRTGCPQDARELAQETFLRAWRKLGHYDPSRRFSTWLFTLARHAAVGHLRRAPRPVAAEHAPEMQGTREASPEHEASRREELGRLWSLAARVLKDEQRSALWLRYGEDLPIPEIARVLGRRESTVRVQLFRARERLALELAAQARPVSPGRERPARGRMESLAPSKVLGGAGGLGGDA
jgi:RNA polymerase sigma-70 factor (ECF subfamily)